MGNARDEVGDSDVISAFLHIVVTKGIEVASTPGVTGKLRALFVGKAPRSSINGIIFGLSILAGGAVAECMGEQVAWDVVSGFATAAILGGRAMRGKKAAAKDAEVKP